MPRTAITDSLFSSMPVGNDTCCSRWMIMNATLHTIAQVKATCSVSRIAVSLCLRSVARIGLISMLVSHCRVMFSLPFKGRAGVGMGLSAMQTIPIQTFPLKGKASKRFQLQRRRHAARAPCRQHAREYACDDRQHHRADQHRRIHRSEMRVVVGALADAPQPDLRNAEP